MSRSARSVDQLQAGTAGSTESIKQKVNIRYDLDGSRSQIHTQGTSMSMKKYRDT